MRRIDKEAVREIIASVLEIDPEEVGDGMDLVEDLGMDSMMALEIVAWVEKKFHIVIPEEKLEQLRSINLNGLILLLEGCCT